MKIQIPSVPHLLHIETTYACNQKCLFCYNPYRDRIVDQNTIKRIVNAVYRAWVPHVYLIGGEPSLLGTKTLNGYIETLSQRSSVTIVTNGQIYLNDLSDNLACIGIPLHGLKKTHDRLANKAGSFEKALFSINHYVGRGFDVRCIPVLTKANFNQMFAVIRLAKDLGMESVFVDRYEDGGIGSSRSADLKPTFEQFKIALDQMIKARDKFSIPVGWGTAIPFCLDERLIDDDMGADCGAGVTFCAVDPTGNLRVCNQSERVYGNVLEEPIEKIWHKPSLAEFRDLKWVEKPCLRCHLLLKCLCGCKVDASYSPTFCIDYAVREMGDNVNIRKPSKRRKKDEAASIPKFYRNFQVNRYTRLNKAHREHYLVTRYQTVEIDETGEYLLKQILNGETSEKSLITKNLAVLEAGEVRKLISSLEKVGAIDCTGGQP